VKRWKKICWAAIVVVAGLFIVVAVGWEILWSKMCGNETHSENLSPDGTLKAIVFQRDSKSIAHIIEVNLAGVGLVRDVGLLRE